MKKDNSKNVITSVNLKAESHAYVNDRAELEQRSFSNMINVLIKEAQENETRTSKS